MSSTPYCTSISALALHPYKHALCRGVPVEDPILPFGFAPFCKSFSTVQYKFKPRSKAAGLKFYDGFAVWCSVACGDRDMRIN